MSSMLPFTTYGSVIVLMVATVFVMALRPLDPRASLNKYSRIKIIASILLFAVLLFSGFSYSEATSMANQEKAPLVMVLLVLLVFSAAFVAYGAFKTTDAKKKKRKGK